MLRLFERSWTREELLRYVGDPIQLGGVRRHTLSDGNQAGVEVAQFRTGSGLEFDVLLGRAMDISAAFYKGSSLCWRSATGDVAAPYFEPEGLGWLRTFFGGLVVTCGLDQVGAPCVDRGQPLGLHGRISTTPAANTWVDAGWDGDDYVMWAQGRMRQATVFGENISLTRKIWARLGESRFFMEDTVENLSFDPAEHMFLYHINLGFPVVSDGSVLIAPSKTVTPRDAEAEQGKEDYWRFTAPVHGFKEKCYFHEMAADEAGKVTVAVANEEYAGGRGLGVYVRYDKTELPWFTEWKMMGEGVYVVGVEPANCCVLGRAWQREHGSLQVLGPREKREYRVEIGVLDGRAGIEELKRAAVSSGPLDKILP
ncbi:MAG: aldose 1-epimerase family protein [Firmicutes bacterium]|nr:aldose 1-epimerase family protein [Bacillota bacterium]